MFCCTFLTYIHLQRHLLPVTIYFLSPCLSPQDTPGWGDDMNQHGYLVSHARLKKVGKRGPQRSDMLFLDCAVPLLLLRPKFGQHLLCTTGGECCFKHTDSNLNCNLSTSVSRDTLVCNYSFVHEWMIIHPSFPG